MRLVPIFGGSQDPKDRLLASMLARSAFFLFTDMLAVVYVIVWQRRRLTACWEVVA